MADMTMVLFIDVFDPGVDIRFVSNYKDYSRILRATGFECYNRIIGDREYLIYCDEFGALKSDRLVSAVDTRQNPAFYGNLIIERVDEYGESVSLEYEDVNYILNFIRTGYYPLTGHRYPVLVDIGYPGPKLDLSDFFDQ